MRAKFKTVASDEDVRKYEKCKMRALTINGGSAFGCWVGVHTKSSDNEGDKGVFHDFFLLYVKRGCYNVRRRTPKDVSYKIPWLLWFEEYNGDPGEVKIEH